MLERLREEIKSWLITLGILVGVGIVCLVLWVIMASSSNELISLIAGVLLLIVVFGFMIGGVIVTIIIPLFRSQ